jgi:hypothetical protein
MTAEPTSFNFFDKQTGKTASISFGKPFSEKTTPTFNFTSNGIPVIESKNIIPVNNTYPAFSAPQGFSQEQEDRIRCLEFQQTTFNEALTKIYEAYMLGDTYDSFRGALACNLQRIEQMQKMLVDFNTRIECMEFQMRRGGKRKREE